MYFFFTRDYVLSSLQKECLNDFTQCSMTNYHVTRLVKVITIIDPIVLFSECGLSLRMTWCKFSVSKPIWIWPSHWILRHSFSNLWFIQCCGNTLKGGSKSWFVQSNHILYLNCTERPAQGSVIRSEVILPVYKLMRSYVQMNSCEILLCRRVKVSFYAAYHNLMNQCPIDIRNMKDPRNCKTCKTTR